jgi:hypothetical protein
MNRETILKHHKQCTVFLFNIDSINEEEISFLTRANTMVLKYMRAKNLNCFVANDETLEFIIGGDCTQYEDILKQNITFGLNFIGIHNVYLGMVVNVS